MQKISSSNVPTCLSGLPCSKSYANRALVYSYLKKYESNLILKNYSEDVKFMKNALASIDKNEIFLGEGGTTIRFLLPLLAMKNTFTKVLVHPDFKKRPMKEFFQSLIDIGAKIEFSDEEKHLCSIKGPLLKNSSLVINCEKTTQFASAMMMIAPFINLDLELINLNHSKKYIAMTKDVIRSLNQNKDFAVPIDYSSASYFIAYSLLNQDMHFPEINKRDSYQADDTFLDIIQAIGGRYHINSEGLKVFKASNLRPIICDVSECIDLTMTLVYLAIFTDGEHKISGINNLKYKETNRTLGIESILKSLSVNYSLSDSSFIIEGNTYRKVSSLNPQRDHRLVMMSSLILKQIDGGEVKNADAVNKSFPNFFEFLN